MEFSDWLHQGKGELKTLSHITQFYCMKAELLFWTAGQLSQETIILNYVATNRITTQMKPS
jgi:hypothetical protein